MFRLDALDKAERVLAHAISSAHILGLHRKAFYARLSIFDDEMYTRVWWAIYILDRRLSLESGRPFLIQDANIDIRTPLNVSDAWLTQYKSSNATISELASEIDAEKELAQHTVVLYLNAFISQSQIATDVWKAVYSTTRTAASSGVMLHDYLDIALDSWWERLPPNVKYDESKLYQDQCSDLVWWQIKQCINLHMVHSVKKRTALLLS